MEVKYIFAKISFVWFCFVSNMGHLIYLLLRVVKHKPPSGARMQALETQERVPPTNPAFVCHTHPHDFWWAGFGNAGEVWHGNLQWTVDYS